MHLVLAVLLATGSPASVDEQFARTRAAVERAKGLEFNFELRGKKTVSGWGGVVPNGPMLITTPGFVLWSDGKDVELRELASRTVWTTAMHRNGTLLINKYVGGVADAFSSATRFHDTLVYKPKLAGTADVRGRQCNVVAIEFPGGGWRWYFDREDHLLRRQERITKDGTETIDYWNVRKLGTKLTRPARKGFTAKTYSVGGPEIGTAPRWTAKTIDGQTISSDSLRGRVAVVDFWATWCGPCRPSMKALQALHEKNREVRIIGLRWQDSGDALAFAKANGITYPLGDAGDAAATFALERYGIPVMFVIGRDGRVVDYTVGYNAATTDAWLERTIARALTSPPS
jgi:thiol-disulfide isomerase/thioredoxin